MPTADKEITGLSLSSTNEDTIQAPVFTAASPVVTVTSNVVYTSSGCLDSALAPLVIQPPSDFVVLENRNDVHIQV